MADPYRIVLIIHITVLVIAGLSTLIYLIPIICIRRFHTATNLLTINVCISTIITTSFWIISDVIHGFYSFVIIQSTYACIFIFGFPIIVNCLLIYSLAIITFNRFLTITYPNKRFFKRHAWYFVSTSIQWLVVIIFSIPNLTVYSQQCIYNNQAPYWINIYTFIIIIILPIIFNGIFNSLIFLSVRSSTRRVHALVTTTTTTTNVSGTSHQENSRDIRLLKHMLFIFIVFIIGWAPIYIIAILNLDETFSLWIQLLQILPVISSLIIVLDLFYYNHDLRRYLKERCLKFMNVK